MQEAYPRLLIHCGGAREALLSLRNVSYAYAALVDFAGVVKAHPITASTPASTVSGGSIGPAASKLAAAAYPFIQDVDWTSDLALKPIPGATPQTVMKAVDKMIVMGSA